MKTPKFWQDKNSLIAKALFLPSCLFFALSKIDKLFKKTYKSSLKVICVGNIVVGGSGKTPIAIAIARILQKNGKKIAFLSRGYKGRLAKIVVDPKIHTPTDVGDEPLLLSKIATTIVSSNRAEGAKIAEKMGIEYLIMDDGFQNAGLKKDLSILVFDGSFGLGNEYLLPSGPLRESLKEALKRADFAIVSGEDKVRILDKLKGKIPILRGKIVPDYEKTESLKSDKFVAFAGIGRPEKFFATLSENGIEIVDFISFPDHYYYSEQDIKAILEKSKNYHAKIITTSKDYIKIPTSLKHEIEFLPVEFCFSDDNEISSRLFID